MLPAAVVIWTTTPWTMPANRAIAFSSRVAYGLYEVTEAAPGNWASVGHRYILADLLAASVFKAARVEAYRRVGDVAAETLSVGVCAHPLASMDTHYRFQVPLLEGDHVTAEAGTGFVHTAPGHGREDFELWTASTRHLQGLNIDTRIPYTVGADGGLTADAPGFEGRLVIDDKGNKGDANDAVFAALTAAGTLVARGKLKHAYPHSWRSKKPVIFRNTPQWFIAMDQPSRGCPASEPLPLPRVPATMAATCHIRHRTPCWARGAPAGPTLRAVALDAIRHTQWVPASGESRINGMIANRPDWVVSRQRAWGVPIAIFTRPDADGRTEILTDDAVNARIAEAFAAEGADAWYMAGARERFLGALSNEAWEPVRDIPRCLVRFRVDACLRARRSRSFPGAGRHPAQGRRRPRRGHVSRRVGPASRLVPLVLAGKLRHARRGAFDAVLTHGFTLDDKGRKMSKSLGNVVAPQKIIAESGADILRLWVAGADYADDQRIGPEILKTTSDTYRKLANTLRWMLARWLTRTASARPISPP